MIAQYQIDRIWKQIGPEATEITNQFLNKGLAQGSLVSDELEQRLAADSGRAHCVLTGNCTDALWIAIEILKYQGLLKPNFRAAIPGMSWVSSVTAVLRAGGTPVFYDIADNYCLDADQNFSSVDLIMAVDLLGNSCNWEKLESQGKLIVHDAAQSFTTIWQGRRSLTRGTISCTSFSPLKSVTSLGSGGAVFTDDAEQARLAKLLRLHFKVNNQDPQQGIGINSVMNAFEVACVTTSMKYHLEWQQRREEIARYYYSQLGNLFPMSWTPENPEVKNTLHKVILRHKQRAKFFEKLHNDQILVYPTYIALYSEPVFKNIERQSKCLNSSKMSFEGFLLPNQHTLTDAEVELVADRIKQYL